MSSLVNQVHVPVPEWSRLIDISALSVQLRRDAWRVGDPPCLLLGEPFTLLVSRRYPLETHGALDGENSWLFQERLETWLVD